MIGPRRQGALPPAFRPWVFGSSILCALLLVLVCGGGAVVQAAEQPKIDTLQTADGAVLRWAWWPTEAKARGTVVLLEGRCEHLEKYQEVAEDWLSRGFQVFSLDWRGQGRSTRFLADRQKCHMPDYNSPVADLTQWLDTVVRPHETGPTVLFAHSMGGLIGLRFLLDQPTRFAAVVLSSPMVDINTDPWPRFLAEMIARIASAFGFAKSYAFGQDDYDPAIDAVFDGNAITSDPVRFRRIHDGYGSDADFRIGGVTFGWLTASFRTQAVVAVPGALQDVRVPVLLLAAPDDRLVPAETQQVLCRRLHDCTAKLYPDARHDILAERDEIRSRAWRDIDAFLSRALTPQAAP